MKLGGLRSLLAKPLAQDKIPVYPSFDYVIAKGGEITYDIPDSCVFNDGKPVLPYERFAEPGEKLRDVDLRYLADTKRNKIFRGETLRRCREKPHNIELEMMYCASDIRYFINVYGWTFVPGEEPVPFVSYKFQDEFLMWAVWLIKLRLTGLSDKSREMGVSWLTQVVLAYMVLFFPNMVGYELSMTESEVDDRTCDSLMGKLRFFIMELPDWMRCGWNEYGKSDKGEMIDKSMEMKFPKNDSIIKGKLTGGGGGRSGRSNCNIYDEFSYVENAKEVLSASASLARCKVFVSTVRGMNNEFARMSHKPGIIKMTLHWRLHPLKNTKWSILERAKPEYDEETWAQEQDIEYETSTSGRVYSKLRTKKRVNDWYHIRDSEYFRYDPNYDVYVGMDFGISDPNSIVFMQIKPPPPEFPNAMKSLYVFIDEDDEKDQTDLQLCVALKGKGYNIVLYVGDLRTGNRRNSGGDSMIANMRKEGIHVVGRYNSEEAPIKQVRHRLSLQGAFAIDKVACPHMVEAMQNWSFPIDKNTGLPIVGSKPLHNKYSHKNKAVAYLIDYLDGQMLYTKKKPRKRNWDYDPIMRVSM